MEVAGGTGVSGALCCCMGRHRLPWELVSLGHHTQGSLLTAGISFSNQRAAGAKACWGVNHVSALYLLHFTSGVYFKQLSGSSLCLASCIPHCPAAPQSCCAGAGVPSAPWQVLEAVQDVAGSPREDAEGLGRGGSLPKGGSPWQAV